ncbi:hypothetical protein EVAR_81721_1 [Eumeta japonica]|uniref:Uncharacterized protein n=1 Tax=Eumeta variegata TaxID=151549 RepID=A0A4C1UHB6_EUMVA|nr:hypothetical protein EVAR_81721_1 [Eumeta japonica]
MFIRSTTTRDHIWHPCVIVGNARSPKKLVLVTGVCWIPRCRVIPRTAGRPSGNVRVDSLSTVERCRHHQRFTMNSGTKALDNQIMAVITPSPLAGLSRRRRRKPYEIKKIPPLSLKKRIIVRLVRRFFRSARAAICRRKLHSFGNRASSHMKRVKHEPGLTQVVCAFELKKKKPQRSIDRMLPIHGLNCANLRCRHFVKEYVARENSKKDGFTESQHVMSKLSCQVFSHFTDESYFPDTAGSPFVWIELNNLRSKAAPLTAEPASPLNLHTSIFQLFLHHSFFTSVKKIEGNEIFVTAFEACVCACSN